MAVRRRQLQELGLDRRVTIPRGSGRREAKERFDCFGSSCAAFVIGDAPGRTAQQAVAFARSFLLDWHSRLSRFDPTSELSRLNADPGEVVAVSGDVARLAQAVVEAARQTGGLVDGTLVREIETAGYRTDLGPSVPLPRALAAAPPRRVAGPSQDPGWSRIAVDLAAGTVTRPPGVALDSGGIAKGLAADLLADALGEHASCAIDAAGDVRVGGAEPIRRDVQVASPFDGSILHTYRLTDGGAATSGIGRRSWIDAEGRPAHHLLDPATGTPAFTGVVQATALAPSALEAEARAKAALLSGPDAGRAWLPDGGVLVLEDATHEVVDAAQLGGGAPTNPRETRITWS